MSLPKPPSDYDMEDQAVTRGIIDKSLNAKIGKGEILERQIFISPNGTKYFLSVSNAGATVWTAV